MNCRFFLDLLSKVFCLFELSLGLFHAEFILECLELVLCLSLVVQNLKNLGFLLVKILLENFVHLIQLSFVLLQDITDLSFVLTFHCSSLVLNLILGSSQHLYLLLQKLLIALKNGLILIFHPRQLILSIEIKFSQLCMQSGVLAFQVISFCDVLSQLI